MLGDLAFEQEDYRKAAGEYHLSIAQKMYGSTYLKLGLARLGQGNYSAAINSTNMALESTDISVNHTIGLAVLGWAYYYLGDTVSSEKEFQEALSLDSKNGYALEGLGNIRLEQNNFIAALDFFKKTELQYYPYRSYARYYLSLGNSALADEALSKNSSAMDKAFTANLLKK